MVFGNIACLCFQAQETICSLPVSDQIEGRGQCGSCLSWCGLPGPRGSTGLACLWDSANDLFLWSLSSCHTSLVLLHPPSCCTCYFLCLDCSASRSSWDWLFHVVQGHRECYFLQEAFLDYPSENVPHCPSHSLSTWLIFFQHHITFWNNLGHLSIDHLFIYPQDLPMPSVIPKGAPSAQGHHLFCSLMFIQNLKLTLAHSTQ